MEEPFWLQIAAALEHYAAAAAVVVGGIWAVLRFDLFRSQQAALEMRMRHDCCATPNGQMVLFTVLLKNRGRVMITAKRARDPAYEDCNSATNDVVETLSYSCSLLVRRLPDDLAAGQEVRWFDETLERCLPSEIHELDLLDDYVANGKTDFWIEPKESYRLTVGLVVKPGRHLAMLTFVGDRNDSEFWRRLFVVDVPGAGTPPAAVEKVFTVASPVAAAAAAPPARKE